MSFFGLLLRNLWFHRRGNAAVFLGVVLGTAVLTGALLVGDSLRGSLRTLALDQLGWVDQAMVANRFFRQALAEKIEAGRKVAAIVLQSNATRPTGEKDESGAAKLRRASKVTLLAVEAGFWPEPVPIDKEFWQSDKAEVLLNQTLADVLQAKVGDIITLNVQKTENIPRESLLGKRKAEDVLQAVEVKVCQVLPDQGMARFTLKPSPEPVRNAFLPLKFLQSTLGLAGRANVLLVGDAAGRNPVSERNRVSDLQFHLTLDDWNLTLRGPEDRARDFVKFLDPRNKDGRLFRASWLGRVPDELAKMADAKGILTQEAIVAYYQKHRPYVNLESKQLFLEPGVAQTALQQVAGPLSPWKAMPILVYLADSISDGKQEIPYAVIAAMKPEEIPAQKALLQDDQIALVDWPQSPLQLQAGDKVQVEYFLTNDRGHLEKKPASFRLGFRTPLEGIADDPDFTPEFPGITDKLSLDDWDPEKIPFPYDPKRVKTPDEDYWKRYRATPRAYVTLKTGQSLWGSRHGQLTSIRFSWEPKGAGVEGGATPSGEGKLSDEVSRTESLTRRLLGALNPAQGGFVFQDVKKQGLQAGAGATDFGMLFLAFSFFLIVAALLLVGLLFRLNLDRRTSEIGLLLATGWQRSSVRRLLLGEGAVLAVAGSLVGLVGAVFYAQTLLDMLTVHWPGEEKLTFLHLHTTALSFIIGLASSMLVSFLTIVWATRVLGKLSPRALLAGETTVSVVPTTTAPKRRWSLAVAGLAVIGAGGCVVGGLLASGHEAQAMSFFGSGALLLTAGLAATWAWLRSGGTNVLPQRTLGALGMRNAGRHPVRSLLTVGLLAAATFLIVAVESFHKETGEEFFARSGGSGGFPLLAESDVSLFQDLGRSETRRELNFPASSEPLFAQTTIFSLRRRAGDDASCLNLYQPLRPRLLGVPAALIRRDGFHFKAGLWKTPEEEANPWLLLEQPAQDGALPAFADANTAQWILKVPLGGILEVPDDRGQARKLCIVAVLAESIFQSELLLSEGHFLQLYPRQEGFNFFLIDVPRDQTSQLKNVLESTLGNQGFALQSTAQRLKAYLEVENTYLATFQALGGLGLLLGALGLAVVLLRGVWERRGELALLRALGFRRLALAWLVLAENSFLLLLGLASGTIAALVAVAPHLGTGMGALLLPRLAMLLGLVVLVGLIAGTLAVAATLRAPLIQALRKE